MPSPDTTTRPSTDQTVVLPSLATAQEPWYAILREELNTWHRQGRVDDGYWVHAGVRGVMAMERDVLVLEAHSLACAGSLADLAPRMLDLERHGRELVWRIDTHRMTIAGSVICRDAQRMPLDEVAARLLNVMQRVREAKPILDGQRIETLLVDLDRRAEDMDTWIRSEIRMARTRPKRDLPPYVPAMRRDIERALASVLGFSRDELQGIVEVIGMGKVEEEDLRRLIGYMHAEREALDLVARFGTPADEYRVYQLIAVQESQWEDVDLRPLSRCIEWPTRNGEQPSEGAQKQETSPQSPAVATAQSIQLGSTPRQSPSTPPQGTASTTPAAPAEPAKPAPPRTPQFFAEALSRCVIGQDEAVRAWALALHQHEAGMPSRGAMLLDGPTGCGKSHIGTCAAKLANVPFLHISAASLVPEGIVGQTVSDVCIAALTNAAGDIAVAERSIILFDEIDKLSDVVSGGQLSKYGTEIIHQLLRFLDGCDYHIDHYKTPSGKKFPQTLSTRRMLIAFSGAWTCLRSTVPGSSIGFTAAPSEAESGAPAVTDLGLPLEMVGRISRLVHLQPHTTDSLMAILRSETASPLRQVRTYLAERQASLSIDDQLLMTMAQDALSQGTGARGLVTIAQTFTDCIFWNDPVEGKRFHLTANGTLRVEGGNVATTVAV